MAAVLVLVAVRSKGKPLDEPYVEVAVEVLGVLGVLGLRGDDG